MKKTTERPQVRNPMKLTLDRELLRTLTDAELRIAGGRATRTNYEAGCV